MLYAGLCAIGLFISLYLAFTSYFNTQLVCGITDCGVVNSSKYATFLGIKLSFWGILYYLFCLFLIIQYILANKPYSPLGRLANFLGLRYFNLWHMFLVKYYLIFWVWISLFGLAFSAYLTYLEAFVINAWCQWCIASAWICVCLAILSIMIFKKNKWPNRS